MRLFVSAPLQAGQSLTLPPGPSRHAQVRRVQPGDSLWLFDGSGQDWPAQVSAVTRQAVTVRLGEPRPVAAELALHVTLAVGMPANERMDTLVEKATELGVAVIQPLLCERAVLRLSGERAARKCAHWQAIAQAACEQSGRAVVPRVAEVLTLPAWLAVQAHQSPALRLLLSPQPGAMPMAEPAAPCQAVISLSGPEGGLSPAEEAAAVAAGFTPIGLGPRVLRADTAPLALMSLMAWFALPRPGLLAG